MPLRLLMFIFCGVLISPFSHAVDIVKFWAGSPGRNEYDTALLIKALEATRKNYGDYEFVFVERSLGTNRGRRLASEGEAVNIYAAPVRPKNSAASEELILVDFPILQGLLGYRRLIIDETKLAKYSRVNRLSELASYKAGLGRGWMDADILRYNNMRVNDSGTYSQLFDMLERKRFDYMLLGAHEITQALAIEKKKHPNLVIEPNIVLYYPLPVAYQVSRSKPELAKRVLEGLNLLKANGEFDQLFMAHFADTLQSLRKTRVLLTLENPYCDEQEDLTTPLLERLHQ